MTQIPIPTSPQPATILDDLFNKPAKIITSTDIDIKGRVLTDAEIQRLAGCPGGGQVVVRVPEDDADDGGDDEDGEDEDVDEDEDDDEDDHAVRLAVTHSKYIENKAFDTNHVALQRDGEDYYLYLDYIWFSEACEKGFGAVALLNMAYTARDLGFTRIDLLAAGGTGIKEGKWNDKFWGYETWPRLGFDTELHPKMLAVTEQLPQFRGITHLSQIVEADLPWWKIHGDGRTMTFDLSDDSPSWGTLYKFCKERRLLK